MTIGNILDLIATNAAQLSKEANGQEAVFFLGNTKAGKSSIVSCLSGKQLEVVQVMHGKHVVHVIQNAGVEQDAPLIGVGARSITSVPTFWNPKSDLNIAAKLCDMPGFDDNRGEDRDIANAFCMKEVINNVASAKFVLVSAISDLDSDNVSQFISLLSKVVNLFGSSAYPSIISAMSIVFTKSSDDVNAEYITTLIQRDVMDVLQSDSQESVLARHFIGHPELIGFFPLCESTILPSVDGIVHVINDSSSIARGNLSTINIPISQKSLTYLLDERAGFLDIDCFKKISKAYDAKLDQENIRRIVDVIRTTKEHIESRASLYTVVSAITTNESVLYKAKCIEFIDAHKIQDLGNLADLFRDQVAYALKIIEQKVQIFETRQQYISNKQELESLQSKHSILLDDLQAKEQNYRNIEDKKNEAMAQHHVHELCMIQIIGEEEIARIRVNSAQESFLGLDNDIKEQIHALTLCGKEKVTAAIDELAKICKIDDIETPNVVGLRIFAVPSGLLSLCAVGGASIAILPVMAHASIITPVIFEGIKFVLEYRGPLIGAGAVVLATKATNIYKQLSKEKHDVEDAAKVVVQVYRTDPKALATCEANIEALKLSLLAAQTQLNNSMLQLDAKKQEVVVAQAKTSDFSSEVDKHEGLLVTSVAECDAAKTRVEELIQRIRDVNLTLSSNTITISALESAVELFESEVIESQISGDFV